MRIYPLGANNPQTVREIEAVRRSDPSLEFPGLLDNDPDKAGTTLLGMPILGGSDLVSGVAGDDVGFVSLVTGSCLTRYESARSLVDRGGSLASLIHPSVRLDHAAIGVGAYLQEQVIVQAGAVLGDNVSVHTASIVAHEVAIGDSSFVTFGVCIAGCCRVGHGVFIGANATVLPRITIGDWVIVGAGAVVTKDVPDYAVVVGNPARVVRYVTPPEHDGAMA